MKFPHLDNATTFPGADVHVYDQYVNTYDYNMWTPKTKIKLCHVKWRNDGHDAVKFRDDTARDAWFDELDGETVHLDTSMYIARADAEYPRDHVVLDRDDALVARCVDAHQRHRFQCLAAARERRP